MNFQWTCFKFEKSKQLVLNLTLFEEKRLPRFLSAKKRQSIAPKEDSESESEDEDIKSEKSSGESGSDQESGSEGISESELDFLRQDAAELNISVSPTKSSKQNRKKRAVLASDSSDDETKQIKKVQGVHVFV